MFMIVLGYSEVLTKPGSGEVIIPYRNKPLNFRIKHQSGFTIRIIYPETTRKLFLFDCIRLITITRNC